MDEDVIRLAVSKVVYASQREGRLNQKLVGVKDKETYKALLEQFKEALKSRTLHQEALIKLISEEGGSNEIM